MFVSDVSIHVEYTETNRKNLENVIFAFLKQTKKQPKQIELRFLSVQTKNIFFLFRGHHTIRLWSCFYHPCETT
jgi:hypothetical protein